MSRKAAWMRPEYPLALSSRECLRERLARVPGYVEHARRIAARLATIPGVRAVPDPSQTCLFHVHLPRPGERLLDASAAIAEEQKLTVPAHASATWRATPSWSCRSATPRVR